MTDRELLEKAAKAAGYSTAHYFDGEFMGADRYEFCDGPNGWNPLTDDGDNRRLQVKLRLALIPCEGGGWDAVRYDAESGDEVMVASDSDPNMAIVRAAAEIGETL